MATQALSGKTGSVAASGGTGGAGTEVKDWNATVEVDVIEATSFDSSGYKEFISGLTGGTGSFSAVGTAPVVGPVTTLTLQAASSTGAYKLVGAAIINNVGPAVDVAGVVEFSTSFTFTGAITIGTVSS